jgi:hypothetical protein
MNDEEILLLDSTKIQEAHDRYHAVFKCYPKPEVELTAQQITGFFHQVLACGLAPYVDFALWGPYWHRLQRVIKFTALVLSSDGSLMPTEFKGPKDYDAWDKCFACLVTASIMFDVADLGNLQSYQGLIKRYHERYGAKMWGLIYQADVRCRQIRFEHVRRDLDRKLKAALAAHGTTDFDPGRPWNSVFLEATLDSEFWKVELEEPALVIMADRSTHQGDFISGDAPATGGYETPRHNGSKRNQDELMGDSTSPVVRRPRHVRQHNVEEGKHKTNRRGTTLCAGFQSGSCTVTLPNNKCGNDFSKVHQCEKCLREDHGSKDCNKELRVPSLPSGKGKNAGKGKGKDKGKRHW